MGNILSSPGHPISALNYSALPLCLKGAIENVLRNGYDCIPIKLYLWTLALKYPNMSMGHKIFFCASQNIVLFFFFSDHLKMWKLFSTHRPYKNSAWARSGQSSLPISGLDRKRRKENPVVLTKA